MDSPLGFSDYRTFLKHLLESRKEKNSSYSLRALARDISMSPSQLSAVLSGKKRISVGKAYTISKHLQLSHHETEYLLSLVELQLMQSKIAAPPKQVNN